MKTFFVILVLSAAVFCLSFKMGTKKVYGEFYHTGLETFKQEQNRLYNLIKSADLGNEDDISKIRQQIVNNRAILKRMDFWWRYLEPIMYRKINGPLPVEWETEVFEKFEPPYRRQGGGLSLLELALDDGSDDKPSLLALIDTATSALETFQADSITSQLQSFDHFFLANRLYILNLGALYTTGFECPDTSRIIPELKAMMKDVKAIYDHYNTQFPGNKLSSAYFETYEKALRFVEAQPNEYSRFDHFHFLRDHVNPLFKLNQQFITNYNVRTINVIDYSLDNYVGSIFDKQLFMSQNTKGIFSLVEDPEVLSEIRRIGKLLFYDPILSGNNQRSCASCHKPTEYFTDTTQATALQFDRNGHLTRNTPTLINSIFNHLLMYDGKHISLQAQARDVITNPKEMNSDEKGLLKKLMSVKEYKDAFKRFVKLTPEEKEVSLNHIVGAITFYYADFSQYYSPFDRAMNQGETISDDVKQGFNLFMSKAQCGTCHFVPHFNGIKPPYVGSEFEVLGTPADKEFRKLSEDRGRYEVNPVPEMMNAFRTGTVRNAEFTKPYMHNGVFNTLEEVIDFYDAGGGAGKKIKVDNQTLASDSLKLSTAEKAKLITFIRSLNENVIFEDVPQSLPPSSNKTLNNRKVGGEY